MALGGATAKIYLLLDDSNVKSALASEDASWKASTDEMAASTDKVTASTDEMAAKTEENSEKSSGALGKIGAGAAIAGVAILGLAADSVKAALAGEKSQAQLQNAIGHTNVSYASVKPAIDKVISSQALLGNSADTVRSALATLTTATGSPVTALKDLQTASDLAAAKNISLSKAATLVGKVADGQTAPLKRYGIDLGLAAGGTAAVKTATTALATAQQNLTNIQNEVNSGQITGAKAAAALASAHTDVANATQKMSDVSNAGALGISALNSKFGGSAQGQADTYAGKMKAFQTVFENLKESLGENLLPVLSKLAGIFANDLPAAITGTEIVINALKPLFNDIGTVVEDFASVLESLWDLVDDLFHGRWGALWQDVENVFVNTWHTIEAIVSSVWSAISGTVIGALSGLKNDIVDGFDDIVGFVESLPGRMLNAAEDIGSAIWHGIIGGIEGAVGAIGGMAKALYNDVAKFINAEFIDPISNFTINLPLGIGSIRPFSLIGHLELPQLATGGIVKASPGGTAVILGEGGRDEMVTPLGAGGGISGGGSVTNNQFVFNGPVTDKRAVTQWVLDAIAYGNRTGMTSLEAA